MSFLSGATTNSINAFRAASPNDFRHEEGGSAVEHALGRTVARTTNRHDDVRLHYNPDGSAVLTINGKEHELTPEQAKDIKLDLAAGDDRFDVSGDAPADAKLEVHGGKGNDELRGGSGDEVFDGGSGGDTIHGGAGRDTIHGSYGGDTIDGGEGDDVIDGGRENDTIRGGAGNDRIDGGKGDDRLEGNEGDDHLNGGKHADTLIGGAGVDTMAGYKGADLIYATPDDRVHIDAADEVVADTTVAATSEDPTIAEHPDAESASPVAEPVPEAADERPTEPAEECATDTAAATGGNEETGTGTEVSDEADPGNSSVADSGPVPSGPEQPTEPTATSADSADEDSGTVTTGDGDDNVVVYHDGPDALHIDTGDGDDRVQVVRAPGAGPVTIDTGDGNDTVVIGAPTGSLSIDAGDGDDTVVIGTDHRGVATGTDDDRDPLVLGTAGAPIAVNTGDDDDVVHVRPYQPWLSVGSAGADPFESIRRLREPKTDTGQSG